VDTSNPDYNIYDEDDVAYSTWSIATTYTKGQVVKYDSTVYTALQDENLAHTPPTVDPYEDDWWKKGFPVTSLNITSVYGSTAGANRGISYLAGTAKLRFKGKLRLHLPITSDTGGDWTHTNTYCIASSSDPITAASFVSVNKVTDQENQYEINVSGATALRVELMITGMAPIV
jgi:hypothetical protein